MDSLSAADTSDNTRDRMSAFVENASVMTRLLLADGLSRTGFRDEIVKTFAHSNAPRTDYF
jgi:hypothetical protein